MRSTTIALSRRVARLRVPLGLPLGGIALYLAMPTDRTLLAGASLAIVGESIRIWAAGHVNKSREVTSSGPYRWCAHPLYAGSSVIGLGLAVAARSELVAALIVAYLGVTLTAAILTEEASLHAQFGDRYEQYRIVGIVDRRRRFSLGRAIANREHRALIGLLVVGVLLALKAS